LIFAIIDISDDYSTIPPALHWTPRRQWQNRPILHLRWLPRWAWSPHP